VQPALLPSARFLAELRKGSTTSMAAWVQARSEAVRTAMLTQAADPERMARWAQVAETSLAEQVRVAQADVGSYEDFLAAYLSVDRLM
jgi:glutamate--cysteine ligase